MLEYARKAVGLMRGWNRADLETDRALGLAILRCLEVFGEAPNHILETVRARAITFHP